MPGMGFNMAPTMGMNMMPSFRMSAIPAMNNLGMGAKNVGLFGKIGSSLKSFNWSGLLTGANKTLNVVNQTIPLIRQAKPMVNNMKSMLKLAKAFGSETVNKRNNNINNNIMDENSNERKSTNIKVVNEISTDKQDSNSNYPNFFI